MQIRQSETRIAANVRLDNKQLNGAFEIAIPELATAATVIGMTGLRGTVRSTGTVRGSLQRPKVAAVIAGDGLRFENFPVDSVRGRLLYRHPNLVFDQIRFNGVLAQVDSLQPPFGIPGVSGGIRYRGWVDGKLENPRAELSIDLVKPSYHQ